MNKLIIAAAGGFGREVLQLAKDINAHTPSWHIAGFIDDNPGALDGYDCSHTIIGSIADWQPSNDEEFVIAIGDMEVRQKVAELLTSKGALFASLIHPTVLIGDNSSLGRGLIMYSYSKINVNCTVGEFVSLASYVSIGHDTQVGNFCALSTGCVITGRVKIGHSVFIGPNSTVLPNLSVGNHVFAVAGSVVMIDIKERMRIMGNPARPFLPNTSK